MSEEITTTTSLLSAPKQQLNTHHLEFDILFSEIQMTCVIQDQRLKEYIIHNQISKGTIVRLSGRPTFPLRWYKGEPHERTMVTVTTLELSLSPELPSASIPSSSSNGKKRSYDDDSMDTASDSSGDEGQESIHHRPGKRRKGRIYDGSQPNDFFVVLFGYLNLLRKDRPGEEMPQINGLGMKLQSLWEMYNELTDSCKAFVDATTAFQYELKECSKDQVFMPFKPTGVSLPRCPCCYYYRKITNSK